MKQFISENGGMLTVIGIGLALLAGYGEWRISANISAELKAQDTVSASDLVSLTVNQQSIQDDIGELKGNDDRLNGKMDQIITILLEDE